MTSVRSDLKQTYEEKPPQYFEGQRADMVDLLPDNPNARVLEIGCGYGGTGGLAFQKRKCSEYFGVEISETAAGFARGQLTDVLLGNVETAELPWPEGYFDALILSEVLEHLMDPWSVLRKLAPLLRNRAVVMASSPNIGQISVIRSLALGRWDLADFGVMDRTHLRWFTPSSYRDLFEMSGFVVDQIKPIVPFAPRTRFLSWLTFGQFDHLFIRQIFLLAHKPITETGHGY